MSSSPRKTKAAVHDHATLIAIACLAMAHKFPIDLSITYLPAILRQNGLDLTQLWMMSLILVPFWFRWAWSPLVDHNGNDRFGHRKSWILPCTLAAFVLYIVISFIDPEPGNLTPLVAMFVLASLVMATQQVASDAYTVENIKPQDRSMGSAYIELGRSAAAIAIAVGLMTIYDRYGWGYTMPVAAVLFVALTLPVLLRKEPAKPDELKQRFDEGNVARFSAIRSNPKGFFSSFFYPFRDFLTRKETGLLVGLIIFMSANLKLVQTTMPVFLVDLGLSLTQIGIVVGIGAAGGSIVGALFAAWMLRKFNTLRNAQICIVLMALAYIPWTILAFTKVESLGYVVFSLFCLGMLATPTQVLVMAARFRWASRAQAGTDFTFQTSAEYVGYSLGAAIAGPLAALVGWGPFFVIAFICSVGGLILLMKTYRFVEDAIEERSAKAEAQNATPPSRQDAPAASA
ncbi:MAG: MFS transporter [Pseudomonadota bacterium]